MIHQRQIAFAILFSSFVACVPAQTPKPASLKPDPWVKDTLKVYRKHISDRKGAKDAAAIELIQEMLKKYETMHPKDQVAFAKGIAESLNSARCKRKPTQDGIYRTTIKALSLTGKNGGSHLKKAFENKKKFKGKDWINLRGDMLEHVGRTKNEKYTDFLLDVALKNTSDTLMAKAGGALRHYKDLKLAPRKKIAKLLIKKFANIYDNANRNLDPGDLTTKTWRDGHAAVSDPWNTSLQKLTKQHYRAANDWNTFWNKHKGANWDKPLKKTR
jgi:hypothetical protein